MRLKKSITGLNRFGSKQMVPYMVAECSRSPKHCSQRFNIEAVAEKHLQRGCSREALIKVVKQRLYEILRLQ